jgi:cytoskeleton protein RodZ
LPSSDSANRTCSVGSTLRESRESRGIPLEEASRVTRIGKNYLTALEEGTFDTLPNPAYVKGFLRAYAAFLGLSGDEIVARYERNISATPPSHHPEEEKGGIGASVNGGETAPRRGRWVVPLILLAFVVVAAFIVEDKGPRPAKAPLPLDAPPAQPVAAPVFTPRSSAQGHLEATDLAAEKGKGDARPADADSMVEGIVLKLKVNQDCRLNITIDDTVSQQYDLKAGDLIEWKGDRVFALDVGNAGGIEAEFNGKPLKSFGEPGKSAHVILKADGASQ